MTQTADCESKFRDYHSRVLVLVMGVPDECFVGPDGRRLPFRVEQRPGLGRCVVAARDIEPTELIISERAAAVGPVQVRSHSAVTVVLQLPVFSTPCRAA